MQRSTWKIARTRGRSYVTLGYTDASHWFRFAVRNSGERQREMILVQDYEFIDALELYGLDESGRLVFERRAGRKKPFNTREFPEHKHAFRLSFPPGQTEVYLKVRSRHSVNLPLLLMSPETYLERRGRERIRMGIYFGVLSFLLLLSLVFYSVFRVRILVYYLAYLTAVFLYMSTIFGYAFQYFWPAYPEWNSIAPLFLFCAGMALAALYSKKFLVISKEQKTIRAFLNICIAVAIVLPLLVPIVSLGWLEAFVASVLVPTVFGGFTIIGIKRYSSGFRAARFYILAWLMYFVLSVPHVLQVFAVVPNGFFLSLDMYEFIMLATMCEFILLPVAMAEQIRDRRSLFSDSRARTARRMQSKGSRRLAGVDRVRVENRLREAMERERLYRGKLTLRELASYVDLSEKELSEYLNETIGRSFYQYVNAYRLNEASELLIADPGRKVIEIAYAVGFGALSTFQRAFQDSVGLSPRQYRKERLANQGNENSPDHGGRPAQAVD